MKSALFVSIAFPPKFDSEGLQVAKYFKYLIKEAEGRMVIDVVTSSVPTLFMPFDNSLKLVDSGYRQKIEIDIRENKYTNYLFRKIWPSLIDHPDSKHSFYRQWRKVIKELKNKPSLIYSRSNPTSSAVMAMKLKEYYNVPWIMHLSDPWADSPVANFTGKVKNLNEEFEKACFSKADKICLTSHQTISFYKKKYARLADKFEYFPNVYDPDDIPSSTIHPKNQKLKLVYTGGIAGNRSPEPFLKAIVSLPPSVKESLEVIFYGIVDRKNKILFDEYKDDSIKYVGSLSTYKEAIALQQSADVLLLIDFPIKEKEKRMYFLSKLLDYMIARKYILAVTGEGSVCWDFINDKMGKCFEEENVKELSDYLIFLTKQFKDNPSFFVIDRIDNAFAADKAAKKLLFLFDRTITRENIYPIEYAG